MSLARIPRRIALAAGSLAAIASTSLAAGALLGACDEGTTGERRVSLKTEIVADDGLDAPFTNAYGWSIQLRKAAISIGPLYYFDGASLFSARVAPSRPRRGLERLLGIREAHAHPGHYQAGTTLGEMLSPASADLGAGVTALPGGDGVTGVYRSARFSFHDPPTGGAASLLGGHVVVIEGEATKGSLVRSFRAEAGVDDVLDSYGEPNIEGCAFEGAPDVQADGTITVHLKPSVWLDQAEFDDVPESTDGAPVVLARDGAAFKAFTRGLKKGSAVVFGYSKE